METKTRKVEILQLVSFVLGNEVFAADVMKVQGVERLGEITNVPGMPDFVEGVINLRNTIIPIIDLRKRFSLHAREQTKDTRIILIELDVRIVVGVIVDKVHEVFQIKRDSLKKIPKLGVLKTKIDRDYIMGIARKGSTLVILMDLEKIFSEEEELAMKSV